MKAENLLLFDGQVGDDTAGNFNEGVEEPVEVVVVGQGVARENQAIVHQVVHQTGGGGGGRRRGGGGRGGVVVVV